MPPPGSWTTSPDPLREVADRFGPALRPFFHRLEVTSGYRLSSNPTDALLVFIRLTFVLSTGPRSF
ncbi:MAG: hypothetical protein M2R45_04435 [Verrucomicrobia subdivision 3 bacterium]|nr:hypothetical protein [Limisphaerales bacterium]MCS1413523.1 hypothetical protein [Limisphaerales bacterium]